MVSTPLAKRADEPAPLNTLFEGEAVGAGASSSAIRYHYDVGADFYGMWLGDDRIYTAAKFHDPITGRKIRSTLAEAQSAKVEYHLDAIRAGVGSRVLDVGCGWGGFLEAALDKRGVAAAVGVTLSRDQYQFISSRNRKNLSVHLQSYETFEAEDAFNGVVTIGALEHFVRPELSADQRLAVYEGYFDRCHKWLKRDGRISLQAITWGAVNRDKQLDYLPLDIFPETDPPTIGELITASSGRFELLHLENSADDYTETLIAWRERLHSQEQAIKRRIGPERFEFYDRYMRRAIAGFRRRRMLLCRFVFRRR
ncbi:MAG: class I SAM-dependent methyltransferase [Pseudomonadota bacterium]